ncbi:TrbG/VirB9 family P-type conjugative transfer protein [Xylella fastidiosa]|uniref:TrbG/VirB9 family P-type conjugative transfer protein n=1 Tax=Xylella fastidiosa TaxID=2371 RepID=UPI003AFB2052
MLPIWLYANDPRIRTEIYNKSSVYNVHTQIGRASLIQLEDGESLEISPSSLLGIGDAEAWNLGVRGNNIVLKPTQKMPQTNVIVVTNKRTYSFELLATAKDSMPTYILRFRYPDTEASKAAAEAKQYRPLLRPAPKKRLSIRITSGVVITSY